MTILFFHTSSTLALCGLIWFVQIVHYPLFRALPANGFQALMAQHQRTTSLVVVPLMLIEAITAVVLAARPAPGTLLAAATGLVLLLIVWTSTLLLQMPAHRRLLAGYDRQTIDRLVGLNWIRTAAWTGRSLLALAIMTTEVSP